jgi:energy-coupling factor transporter ATP-binding protein EcfA2
MIGPSKSASVETPPSLTSAWSKRARDRAAKFFRNPDRSAQETFPFEDRFYAAPDVRDAVFALFNGKCAYCETPYGAVAAVNVEHHRPKAGAIGLDGAFSPDHYWWLAYEWENLLPICPECARSKGSRFPVAKERAHDPQTGADLLAEEPYLLDPRLEVPEEHIAFAEDGTAVGRTDRGRVTIETLGLNRMGLVAQRARSLTLTKAEWEALGESGKLDQGDIERLLDATRPFAAMTRQFVTAWTRERDSPLAEQVVAAAAEPLPEVSMAEQRKLKTSHDRAQVAQEHFSVAKGADKASYFIRTRLVDRVVIRNIRGIEELDFDAAPPATERAPWLMLLGENGTGKSTILQSVALALMGDARRERLKLDPREYLRTGERSGSIEVYLGDERPVRLDVTRTRFKSSEPDPKVLLLGYGASRLLPRAGMRERALTKDFARVENLFNPFAPLANATKWLLSLPPPQFDAVARALKGILLLDESASLEPNRRAKRVDVASHGDKEPLEHLSDGYQSVLAVATDVMSVMLSRWEAMEVAEGTVMIDELGAHLHPRWKMRIVSALRDVFPRVQFLASTHDPLCLRGLLDGEVTLLRRLPEGEIYSVEELPSVEGLRVDQLLTSEFFGLNTTFDPEIDKLFTRYYELKGKWELDGEEEQELERLQEELDKHQVLGRTRRERILLEAADDYLATEVITVGDQERKDLYDKTRVKMAELWAETPPVGTTAP